LPKSKSRRKRPGRPTLNLRAIDTTELDRAVDWADLAKAEVRFKRGLDARFGPGAGAAVMTKVFNHSRWVAVRAGWLDAPEQLGSWRFGVGYDASLPDVPPGVTPPPGLLL